MSNFFKKKKKAFKRKATDAETIILWIVAGVLLFYGLQYWWHYMDQKYQHAKTQNNLVNAAYNIKSKQYQEEKQKENELLANHPDLKPVKQQLDDDNDN